MLKYISVSLRGFYSTAKKLPASAFVKKLGLSAEVAAIGDGKPWQAARIELVELTASDFGDDEEWSERFAAKLNELYLAGADFLSQVDPQKIAAMREEGLEVDIFTNLYLNVDQFDLTIPSAFSAEVGRLGLAIKYISND